MDFYDGYEPSSSWGWIGCVVFGLLMLVMVWMPAVFDVLVAPCNPPITPGYWTFAYVYSGVVVVTVIICAVCSYRDYDKNGREYWG